MSDDPTSPPPEDLPPENAPVPSTDKNGSDASETRNGGMRRYRKGDVEIDDGDDDGEILVVSVKLRPSGGGSVNRRRVIESDEPESRSKVNRFATKVSGPNATGPAGVSPSTVSAVGQEDANTPPPGAPRFKLTPRTPHSSSGRNGWESTPLPIGWKKYLVLALVALAAGYLAGKRYGHPEAVSMAPKAGQPGGPVAKLTTTWPPGRLADLDAILAADATGDLKQARELSLALKKEMPDSPSLDLYLTTLQVRQGEFKIPENDLARSIDAFTPAREAAAINAHLGFLYSRHRDFPRAAQAFADAASTEPFNAEHFRHWAEVLRRQGQLQDAIGRFGEALTRLPLGIPTLSSEREEINFKIRLAQIELGKDADLKTALDAQLKMPVPNGYWLLTGAAYGLQHNDMSLAVSSLQKARQTLSNDDYAALTNDYFFHSYAGGPDLAAYLPPDSPAIRIQPFAPRMGYFIDP